MIRGIAAGLLVAGGLVALAAPVMGGQPVLAMLDGLDDGQWEMRYRGKGGNVQRLCLRDGRTLIQLRHPSAQCDRVVVKDDDVEVTVQYTCPGRGYGRTRIRKETSRLVQVDSQGIANGRPFAFAAEARRIGDCNR